MKESFYFMCSSRCLQWWVKNIRFNGESLREIQALEVELISFM